MKITKKNYQVGEFHGHVDNNPVEEKQIEQEERKIIKNYKSIQNKIWKKICRNQKLRLYIP